MKAKNIELKRELPKGRKVEMGFLISGIMLLFMASLPDAMHKFSQVWRELFH